MVNWFRPKPSLARNWRASPRPGRFWNCEPAQGRSVLVSKFPVQEPVGRTGELLVPINRPYLTSSSGYVEWMEVDLNYLSKSDLCAYVCLEIFGDLGKFSEFENLEK